MKSLVAGGMHYIRTADGLEELYVLQSDPEESTNLAGTPNRPGASPSDSEIPSGRC